MNYNFKKYFENIPDILHININPKYLKEKLDYNLGETINIILENLGKLEELSKIKFLIVTNDQNGKIRNIFKNINVIEPKNIKTFYEHLEDFFIVHNIEKSNNTILNDLDIKFSIPLISVDFKNNVFVNKNCSLNLDFIKYNYHKVNGRNVQIKDCITKIKENSSYILVYGVPGIGKKSLVQFVGKYFFERNNKNVQYLEFYDLDNIEEILEDKIEIIKNNHMPDINNEINSITSKRALLIIYFNFIISDEENFKFIENIIMNNVNKYKKITFLYACTIENITIKSKFLKNTIKLEEISKDKEIHILLNNYFEKTFNSDEKVEIDKLLKLNKYRYKEMPNYYFLELLYLKKIKNENYHNKINITDLLNEFNNKIEKEYKLDKIFSIFNILRLGIRDNILNIFFDDSEIEIIKIKLNDFIYIEKDSKGNNLILDEYFKRLLYDIYKKEKNIYKKYLLLIFENYALIFRYIINNSNFSYDLCKEFHAGINQGFWFSLYKTDFLYKYEKFCNKQNKKKIYFDIIKYYYNIKSIFKEKIFFDIIIENINEFKEYISQIIICIVTILYFTNNNNLTKNAIVFFLSLFEKIKINNNNWEKDILRLNIFKYWSSGNSDIIANEFDKILLKSDMNETDFEIYLIELHYIMKEKIEQKNNILSLFKKFKNLAKNNIINLIRLNILYGIAINYEEKKYFNEAYELSKKLGDNNLKKLIIIELAEYYLKKSEFVNFNKCVEEFEENNNNKKLNDNHNFDKLELRIKEIIKKKDEIYKNNISNTLFFYISEPFYYENNLIENTEINNSFYLKYNLRLKLPKNMKIIFEFIKHDFLNQLIYKFENPSKFIYIGSDYFNEKGQLFYSNEEMNAINFENNDFNVIIKQFKYKTELLILGFINDDTDIIAQYFIDNHFPNIIYINKSNNLMELLENSKFCIYFQRCFYSFIINFIMNLNQDIKNAFYFSLNNLIKQKNIPIEIRQLLKESIIIYQSKKDENKNILFKDIKLNKNTNEVFDFERIYIKFDEHLNDSIFNFLINKRYYGNKELFNKIREIFKTFETFKKYKIINIYGETKTGKSAFCLELCKYFYMNKYFQKGIYYISDINKWDNKNELKNLDNYQKKNNNKYTSIVIIIDDINNLDDYFEFMNNSNLYFIIATIKKIDSVYVENIINQSQKDNKKKCKLRQFLNELIKKNNYINIGELLQNIDLKFYDDMKKNLQL